MMKIYKIFDNGGETVDRFAVVTSIKRYYAGYWSYDALALSSNPDWPRGFSQWCTVVLGKHLGKEIRFEDLPENVQKHVLERTEGM